MKIHMVDLETQYQRIKKEIDSEVLNILKSTQFINGPAVSTFARNLETYLGAKHVIPCANGTDALQIALMAIGAEPGDEIIVPAFTYVASAEVIALLRLTPVMVDVDLDTFNVTAKIIEKAITPRTKAIIPVHLFGQTCDMEDIIKVANKHGIYVIEDNAQAIGSDYTFSNGAKRKAGAIGHIGCTSFFPSKNLGCYGDGGAIMTNDDNLAKHIAMVANHGQSVRYYHDVVGVNSRLDTIQAGILNIKLKHLDTYCAQRVDVADYYDQAFADIPELITPVRSKNSTHVFHQYTLRVLGGKRDGLKQHLEQHNIPYGIYYPVPLYDQKAFKPFSGMIKYLKHTDTLCKEVISLPMHTEMTPDVLHFITSTVQSFFK